MRTPRHSGQAPLGDAIQGNAYEVQDSLPSAQQLPANLLDATRAFEVSDAAVELFGQAFVEHFAASRKWEVREYERHLNDWQLNATSRLFREGRAASLCPIVIGEIKWPDRSEY